MQLVASAFVFAVLLAWMLAARMPRRIVVMFSALPFGATAVVNLPSFGGASITVPNMLAAFLLLTYFFQRDAFGRLMGQMQPWKPGFFLSILIIVALLLTATTPNLFAGEISVFNVVSDINGERQVQYSPLKLSTSNITQSLYLLQSVLIFLVVAAIFRHHQEPRIAVRAIELATVINLSIVAIDGLAHAVGWGNLLSWLRSANYAILDEVTLSGVRRVVGAYSEASSFGYFTAGLFGFWTMYWLYGGRQYLALIYVVALVLALIFSTSTSAYAAMAGLFLIVVAQSIRSLFAPKISRRQLVVLVLGSILLPIAALVTVLALDAVPSFYAFMDQVVFSKLDSQSGVERGSWNREALRVFFETWLFGAGLGSVRASSLIVSSLATIGLPGVLALFAFLVSIFLRPTPKMGQERALVSGAKAACLIMLMHASVVLSSPDLGLLFFSLAAITHAFAANRGVLQRDDPPFLMTGTVKVS